MNLLLSDWLALGRGIEAFSGRDCQSSAALRWATSVSLDTLWPVSGTFHFVWTQLLLFGTGHRQTFSYLLLMFSLYFLTCGMHLYTCIHSRRNNTDEAWWWRQWWGSQLLSAASCTYVLSITCYVYHVFLFSSINYVYRTGNFLGATVFV